MKLIKFNNKTPLSIQSTPDGLIKSIETTDKATIQYLKSIGYYET